MPFSPDLPHRADSSVAASSAATTAVPARGAHLDGVRRAWRATADDVDPRGEPLARALRAFAREGRARGALVGALLRALDRLACPLGRDDEPEPGFERVRDWAGTQVIRAYYDGG